MLDKVAGVEIVEDVGTEVEMTSWLRERVLKASMVVAIRYCQQLDCTTSDLTSHTSKDRGDLWLHERR